MTTRGAALPLVPGDASPRPRFVVAVEATHLPGDVRGIGRYVRAMLPRLLALRPGLHLLLLTRRRRDLDALGALVSGDAALRGRATVGHASELPRCGADLVWYPWNVAVPAPPHGPVVVTMHDVAPLAWPDPRASRWWKNLRWRRRYVRTLRRATVILADSAFTDPEVRRLLGVPRAPLRVAPLAADDFPVPPPAGDAAVLAALGVRVPYVLAVGAADRRKDLGLLCGAMTRVRGAVPGTALVLAGPRRRSERGLRAEPWLLATGLVSDRALAVLYRCAAVLAMPSRYEGFGLPVLEAMRLGTPVVCARSSSLPEVAGDAACWFDPGDEADLAASLVGVLSDGALRIRLRLAGMRQERRFAWDETARLTLRAFDEAVARCRAVAMPDPARAAHRAPAEMSHAAMAGT